MWLLLRGVTPGPSRVDRRRDFIADESFFLGPEHPWAGRYSNGDGLTGTALELAPRAGFVLTEYGDAGPWQEHTLGPVEERNGRLRLRGAPRWIAGGDVHPVRWGPRVYLIPDEDLDGFVNAVNYGFEPRYEERGLFWLRDGDHEKPVEGDPELPEKVRPLLLHDPVSARIVSVGVMRERRERLTADIEHVERLGQVLIDAGSRDGLVPGVELHGDFDSCNRARVNRVWERRAQAQCRGDMSRLPRRGDVLAAGRGIARRMRNPVRIRVEAAPKGVARVKDAWELWGDIAPIRRAGFAVRDMGRLSVEVLETHMLAHGSLRRRYTEAAASVGANFIDSDERPPGHREPGTLRARLYRIEWKGEPLGIGDLPYDPKNYADWEKSILRIELDRERERNRYFQEFARLYERHEARFFALGDMSRERWFDSDLRDLSREQRRALRTLLGVDESWGTVSEVLEHRSRNGRRDELVREAAKEELEALRKALPADYARYEQLRAESDASWR